MKWNDLSMKDRATLILLGVASGVYDIGTIRDTYNEFAEGGDINYSSWINQLASLWNTTPEEIYTKSHYDYQTYYNDNKGDAWKQLELIKEGKESHFPDRGKSGLYKTRNHPTYPEMGYSWNRENNVFFPSKRQLEMDNPEIPFSESNTDRILDYLGHDLGYHNGGAKAVYNNGYILPTVYVTPEENYTLLKRNKLDTGWQYKGDNEFAKGSHLFGPGGNTDEDEEDYYYSAVLPEVTITPQNRRVVNAAGNPYLKQAAQDYVNRAIQEESNIGFQAAQKGMEDATKVAAPIVGAATLGAVSPYVPTILGAVGDASTYLTPGYWLSKAGHPILGAAANLGTGTIGTVEGIKGTARDIKEGNIVKGIGNGLLTAAGAASDLATAKLLNRGYRATHAYNTIVPASYENPKGRFKEFLSSMLENKKYSGLTPEFYTNVGNLTANYLAEDVKNAEVIAAKGREDAFRIYLGLEPKNNIYIKNADGTYSYNIKTLKDLSEGTWHPREGMSVDSFTGAGGLADVNVQLNGAKTKQFGTNSYTPGYYTVEDLWDLHPFSREGDRLLDKYKEKFFDFFSKLNTKLYDKGILGMDAKYPGHRIVGNLENKTINRWRNRPPLEKTIAKLSDKLKKFEVGPVLGGKPFMMHTEIPVTRKVSLEPMRLDLNNPSQTFHELTIRQPQLITGNEQLPYFDSYDDHLPMLFSKPDFNDVNLSEFLNSNLYTTPIKKRKALGGPLVGAAKYYEDGGELNQIQLKPQLNNKVDWLQALRDAGMTAILGPIGSLIPLLRKRKKTENIVDTNIVEEETNPVEFDWNDLRLRQAWTESKNDAKAVSPRGAKGVFLIMDATLLDYLKKTGDIGDIFNPEYNGKVRDYYLKWLMERPVVNTNNPPDSILAAKAMAAYNWGVGNLTDYLIDLKKQGNDIYTSLDWVEGLPKETRDYVNFIVRHRDSGGHRTNNRYKKAFNIE